MDYFNKGAALILATLYDESPKPTHLNIPTLDDQMTEDDL